MRMHPPSAPRIDAVAPDTIPLTARAGTQEMLIAALSITSLSLRDAIEHLTTICESARQPGEMAFKPGSQGIRQ
ncbi:hypothetical protein DXT93_29810 [Agrobacterium rhizogenes]|nr:hypothetical protein [Rhizobium rhizogenes]